MGADIKKLRTRIKSVDSTLHLTKAMGLVASSKIRRATDSMLKSREYLKAVEGAVVQLSYCGECSSSPYITEKTEGKTKLVVIAGDRGLAGGYNANVFKMAKEFEGCEKVPIGKRAYERFEGEHRLVEEFNYSDARELAEKFCNEFVEGKINKLGILYTKYVSMMSQEATVKWVLPLKKEENTIENSSIVFEPDAITVLNEIVPEYVAGVLYACIKESFASEVAARRVAMDSAGKNAQQMIDDLSLAYNRARQGAITQEITEIVAGSDV